MSRSAVKVLLRTRPSDSFAQDQLQISQSSKSVTVVQAGRSSGLPNEKAGPAQQYQFTFDGILHNASQEDVFQLVATDVIQGALEGINGTIMCYGQTGAGKTYTMTGDRQSYKQRGLIPRTIAATLSQLSAAPGLSSWNVSVSYLEIYNEALFDLLDFNTQPHELTLYDDARGQTQVGVFAYTLLVQWVCAVCSLYLLDINRQPHERTLYEDARGQTQVGRLVPTLYVWVRNAVELLSSLLSWFVFLLELMIV
eukprot:GHUV01034069.1.p1 GENE.GHUV01034069.1~~GHUV01034069.1.p1  ORF type:complete len:253 (+),score=49.93 GHUV01034069.1:251-1009(+)